MLMFTKYSDSGSQTLAMGDPPSLESGDLLLRGGELRPQNLSRVLAQRRWCKACLGEAEFIIKGSQGIQIEG